MIQRCFPQRSSLLDEPLPTFLIRVRPHHFFARHCTENMEVIQTHPLWTRCRLAELSLTFSIHEALDEMIAEVRLEILAIPGPALLVAETHRQGPAGHRQTLARQRPLRQMPALARRRSNIASRTKTTALTDHRFRGRIASFTRPVPKPMNKQQGNTPVHIWRVDFEVMEMRTTSPDGIHVWIARDDVMEALQIPDPGYALSFVAPEDQAALSSGADVPDE
jgi:hypothetical protein